jgi:hypothetical protein
LVAEEVALAVAALAQVAVVILAAVVPQETGDVDTFNPGFETPLAK